MLKETITDGKDTFEIVEYVPLGYMIWNIGEHMIDGYLPLCRLSQFQPFPGGRKIEVETLKAIKIDDAQDILAVVSFGLGTLSAMKKYVKRYKNSKTEYVQRRVARCRKAIQVMETIKGVENLEG